MSLTLEMDHSVSGMRCRFCSKSIPLLRRLSDPQFCSDEHRAAYGDEQNLAFERLMTTQAAGKTQRMPAYHQVAEIPQQRPPTQTMVAAGGFQAYFLDAPLPFGQQGSSAEPVASSLTVFFCEHAVSFPARFRHSARLARVLVRPGQGGAKPAHEARFLSACRANLPRAATRPQRWEYKTPVADNDPAPITRLWPIESSARDSAVLSTAIGTLWLVNAGHRVSPLALRAKGLLLQPSGSPCALAAPEAVMAATRPWPLELLPAWGALFSYPSDGSLRAITEEISAALEETNEIDALFEAFANQPLAGSRHLPALASAVLQFGAPTVPDLLPLPAARSPLPFHETDLAGISTLPRATRTFAPRAVEPAAANRVTAGDAEPLLGNGCEPRRPRRKAAPQTAKLPASLDLRSLCPIGGSDSAVVAASAGAIEAVAAPIIPSPAMRGGLRLRVAKVTEYVPNFDLAHSAASGWTPEPAIAAPIPAIPGLAAKHRMAVGAKGTVLTVAAPAARQIVGCQSAGESLAPCFRPWLPALRLAPVRSGHTDGRTRCLALPPPAARLAVWTGPGRGWIGEPEMALLPGGPRPLGSCSLQRPANTLYSVPNAQPLPKAGVGLPLALPMSDWGSKPLMRPTSLRASDGTDFEENPKGGWESALRNRFGKFGSLPTFGRLRRLPPDIKWIAMAIPLIIGIWVVARPEGKASNAPVQISGGIPQAEVEPVSAPPGSEEVQAAAASEPEPPGLKKQREVRPARPTSAEPTRWDVLQAKIADRAAVDIVEDFRSGLSRWEGRGNWARTWSYDRSGTVRPGNLAIFEPTTGLRDYSFEMKAAVDKRVIQWLVRARDLSNYHINRLIVTSDTGQTRLELQRWTVHNGRAGRVKLVPLPHGPANQSLFSVRVEVQGESVTTYLGDQVIDTFNDARFTSGGIGLAGAPGDQARIYAVRISHQTDFLGKLCSFLAPQPMNMQGTD